MFGKTSFDRTANNTVNQRLCFLPGRSNLRAALEALRRDLSIAPETKRSTSICRFTKSCDVDSSLPVILHKLTSLLMRLGITCKSCSVFRIELMQCSGG